MPQPLHDQTLRLANKLATVRSHRSVYVIVDRSFRMTAYVG